MREGPFQPNVFQREVLMLKCAIYTAAGVAFSFVLLIRWW